VSRSYDAPQRERDVFLAAAIAAIAATLDASNLSNDPSSRTDGRLLAAVRHMADLQVEYLIAHDQFIQRCEAIGFDHESIDALREGRAALARRLLNTFAEVEQLTSDTEQRPPR
jgi:hypothetical protein